MSEAGRCESNAVKEEMKDNKMQKIANQTSSESLYLNVELVLEKVFLVLFGDAFGDQLEMEAVKGKHFAPISLVDVHYEALSNARGVEHARYFHVTALVELKTETKAFEILRRNQRYPFQSLPIAVSQSRASGSKPRSKCSFAV